MIIDKLSLREKILLAIVFVVVMPVAFHFYIYQPKVIEVENMKDELENRISLLERESILLAKKYELEDKYENITEQLDERLNRYLFSERKEDVVLLLNKLILEHKIDLLRVETGTMIEEDIYQKYPVSLVLEGEYQAILGYMIGIENLEYLISIDSLEISPGQNSIREVVIRIDLMAYLLAEESGDLR